MRGVLAFVAVAGCYQPAAVDCSYRCGPGDSCPDNLTCMAGYCRSRATGTCEEQQVMDATDAPIAAVTYHVVRPTDLGPNDQFGTSVALSADGARLVVGAPYKDRNSDLNAGSVYVFDRDATTYVQSDELFPAVTTQYFGTSIAIVPNASIVAIGAPGDTSCSGPGCVYLFAGSPLAEQSKIQGASGPLGQSVAMSDDALVLISGSPSDNTNEGSAVFAKRPSVTSPSWNVQVATDTTSHDGNGRYGEAVAVNANGTYAFVSAPDANNNDINTYASAVGVNTWNGDPGIAPIGNEKTDFGQALTMVSPTAIAVGVPGARTGRGAVSVYEGVSTVWMGVELSAAIGDTDDRFGASVHAIKTTPPMLLVGAPQEDSSATGIDGNATDNTLGDAGAAYLFRLEGSTWTQIAYIKANVPVAGARFGFAVSASADGKRLAIGAPTDGGGAVFVFDL